MVLNPPPQASGFRSADIPFAARVRNRLLQQVGPCARFKQIRDGSVNAGKRKTFVDHHVVRLEVATMDQDPFRYSTAQPRARGNGQMDQCRINVGNFIDRECGFVREGHRVGPAICPGPKHGLPILRELARRNIGYAIYPSRDSFDSSLLSEAGENRIGEPRRARLFGRDKTVIVFGQSCQFIETRPWHVKIPCQYLSILELY